MGDSASALWVGGPASGGIANNAPAPANIKIGSFTPACCSDLVLPRNQMPTSRHKNSVNTPTCVNPLVPARTTNTPGAHPQLHGHALSSRRREISRISARANALEGNVRIYHFVNGKRTQFKGVNLKVESGQWHTLRVEFKGSAFRVSFNGKHLFDAEDMTIKDAGKVDVWTKADSVTILDDFSYGAE
jgi:hypothetical protein